MRKTLEFIRKSRFNVVSMADIVDAQNGRRELQGDPVAFTADDGFWDQSEILAPIFLEFDIPLSIFLITDFVDGKQWPWDAKVAHIFLASKRPSVTIQVSERPLTYSLETREKAAWSRRHCLGLCKVLTDHERNEIVATLAAQAEVELPQEPPAAFRPLNWSQARDLERRGIRFGSHTKSHRILSDLDEQSVRAELKDSLARLQQELTQPLSVLCWPFGRARDFGARDIDLAKQCGYEAAFSAIEGYAVAHRTGADDGRRYRLNRFALPSDADQLARHATGLEHVVQSFFRAQRRVSGGTDHLEDAGSEYSIGYLRETLAVALGRARVALGGYRSLRRIDFSRVRRLVFACKGNICRSPYAEAKARKIGIEAISAGTDAIIGAPADACAIRLSAAREVSLVAHRSQPVSALRLEPGDLVIAMEPGQAERVRAACEAAGAQLTLLGLWANVPTPLIPDPYGRSDGSFVRAFETIDQCISALRERLPHAI